MACSTSTYPPHSATITNIKSRTFSPSQRQAPRPGDGEGSLPGNLQGLWNFPLSSQGQYYQGQRTGRVNHDHRMAELGAGKHLPLVWPTPQSTHSCQGHCCHCPLPKRLQGPVQLSQGEGRALLRPSLLPAAPTAPTSSHAHCGDTLRTWWDNPCALTQTHAADTTRDNTTHPLPVPTMPTEGQGQGFSTGPTLQCHPEPRSHVPAPAKSF